MKIEDRENKLRKDIYPFNNILYASKGLTSFLIEALNKELEVKRIARCFFVLTISGHLFKKQLISKIIGYILSRKKSDGGWVDIEETALSLKLITLLDGNYRQKVEEGKKWLISQRILDKGWGRSNRDLSRIPVTGLLLHLFPELSDENAIKWVMNEWKKDFDSETRLTYKGAFFLLGLKASGISSKDCPLIKETYSFLEDEQNEDGGFGPWKDHPIGSDPWSTGTVLLGLLAYPELTQRKVIEKAVNWLAENQLPNGLWVYHYIDEGSAYAYWGLVEALKYLETGQS